MIATNKVVVTTVAKVAASVDPAVTGADLADLPVEIAASEARVATEAVSADAVVIAVAAEGAVAWALPAT